MTASVILPGIPHWDQWKTKLNLDRTGGPDGLLPNWVHGN